MPPLTKVGEDHVAWARKVNSRWIVHQNLAEHTSQYLDELKRHDPARLRESCRRARLLVGMRQGHTDPKPWFYVGIFCLATDAEKKHYLKDHPFLHAILLPDEETPAPIEHASLTTWEIIGEIQTALSKLLLRRTSEDE